MEDVSAIDCYEVYLKPVMSVLHPLLSSISDEVVRIFQLKLYSDLAVNLPVMHEKVRCGSVYFNSVLSLWARVVREITRLREE